MKRIQELLALNEGPASLTDAILDAFKAFKNSSNMKHWSTADEPIKQGSSYEFGIRDWGTWEVPSDAEDDGDYDWEEPSAATMRDAEALIKACEKRFPKFKFSIQGGEKNWLYVSVTAK